jgi:hypothetical protein
LVLADARSCSSAATSRAIDRFYERMVPLADDLYDSHLGTLRYEGLI